MGSDSTTGRRLVVFCLWLGGALIALGTALLAGESFGFDVGPAGANLVVVGAIVASCGIWMLWPRIESAMGIILAAALTGAGGVLLYLTVFAEPLVVGFVAVACLVSGVRGLGLFIGARLPRWRHQGAMPFGEKAALVSLVANGGIAFYLLRKSQAQAQILVAEASEGTLSVLILTVVVIVGVLVVESLTLSVLQGRDPDRTFEDERDTEIREGAGSVAWVVLVVGVLLLAVQFGLGSVSERTALANDALGLSSPLTISHVLIGLLFLSQCARNAAALWSYGRARF